MRHADQLHEGVARRDRLGKRPAIEGIADDHLAPGRHLRFRTAAGERAHTVTALEQRREQPAADVAGAAGDEDVVRHGGVVSQR